MGELGHRGQVGRGAVWCSCRRRWPPAHGPGVVVVQPATLPTGASSLSRVTVSPSFTMSCARTAGAEPVASISSTTMDPETMVTEMTGTAFRQVVAQWTVDYQLNDTNFDLATTPGNNSVFKDGSLIS